MRIVELASLPRAPWIGQRLRVDHASLGGLATGLDPSEQVVLRVRGEHVLATVVRVGFLADETTYDLQVTRSLTSADLASLGAVEAPRRVWDAEDVMAALCRIRRTEHGCEDTCAHCSLNPESDQGWVLMQLARDLR